MTLLSSYVLVYGQLPKFLDAIRQGQAPEKFTRQYLKDLGFKSSNHHALIPLLKGLGFLTADGTPTPRYMSFLDKSRSKRILGEAIKENYSDIFTLKSNPSKDDKGMIAGKFKSTFNTSDHVASLSASTFLALLEQADLDFANAGPPDFKQPEITVLAEEPTSATAHPRLRRPDFHYNIQIHLPPSKDIEVYNAIFKSLREQLLEQ